MAKKDPAGVLNDLITTHRESEEGLGKAAKGVQEGEIRRMLTEFAQRHSDAAEALTVAAEGTGSGHDDVAEKSGWIELEASIRPKDDRSFLEECRKGEEGALKRFDHALKAELPESARRLVEDQRRAVEEMIAQIAKQLATSSARSH